MVTVSEKVRENRARRAAERQGLRIIKVNRRDALARDFGRWHVVRPVEGAPRSCCRGSVDRRREIALTPSPVRLIEVEKRLLEPRDEVS